MTPQLYRTRITDLFGIRHPILCGGLMWLSDARYVAAIVNAGGMGFITPRSFPTPQHFRQALQQARELTGGKPFGVNITISSQRMGNEMIPTWLKVAQEEGVRFFETAGSQPGDLIGTIHAVGGIVIHKASRIRHAQAAERAGADALALVGMEEGGHPGTNELPTFVMGAYALQRLTKPLAIGGGIGHGAQIAAALTLGADAVVMGSRFLTSAEVWAHENYKRHITTVDEDCSTTVLASLGHTWRVLKNDTVAAVKRLEQSGVKDFADYGHLIRGTLTRDNCYLKGDWNTGMVSIGPAAGFATAIEPLEAIVDQLLAEAGRGTQRLRNIQVPEVVA